MAQSTTQPTTKTKSPRHVALDLVASVQEGRLLAECEDQLEPLAPSDRARANRLALTVLRWSDRADRMLGPYLRKKPYPSVLNLLRLGVVEICVDVGAPHGVVHALVSQARQDPETARAAGLVNAVLRRVSENTAKWDTLPAPRLPKKLRARFVAAHGKAAVDAMERAHAAPTPLDLSWRGPEAADLSLFSEHEAQLLPTGSIRLWQAGQVSALPGYAEGKWWVQDAAAAVPARILNVAAGERVLDLCAAPGGKTAQLAATGAHVTALDLSDRRMSRVTENLDRLQLNADLVIADALSYSAPPFDAILLDAPCSATGTIRRHPDLPVA